jgi:uncharacterized protein (DUF305 family)
MKRAYPQLIRAGLLVLAAVTACSRATVPAGSTAAPMARPAVSEADVHFMSGMIPHHAQAILIANWAATHGASRAVSVLSERIVVAQQDEIDIMQTWLRDRGQKVPPADATHLRMTMNGVDHDMLMPGMLTPEELAQLDRARGVEFDRLWLKAMIKHHQGAVSMVDQLLASYGAAQDEIVFKLTSDIYADQTTEIDRMQKILDALPPGDAKQ